MSDSAPVPKTSPPAVLVFDSGLGGLTVFAEIRKVRPRASFTYLADDAVFPYGDLAGEVLVERVGALMSHYVDALAPDLVVIACNTASTLVLPHLRAAFPALPFVGTVPAIKPAAEQSRSRLISVLATPGTVARDYTHDLIRAHALHCDVTLVGSARLAGLAEAFMQGESVDKDAIAAEIAPAFVASGTRRTDHIVLACTHYPLLQKQFDEMAPWPVDWVDPAAAIARRVDHVLAENGFSRIASDAGEMPPARAIFTSDKTPGATLERALFERGLHVLQSAGTM